VLLPFFLGRLLFGPFGRLFGALVRDQVHEVTAFQHARIRFRVAQIVDFSHSGILFPGERLLLLQIQSLCFVVAETSRTRNRFLSVSKTVAIINGTPTILVPVQHPTPKSLVLKSDREVSSYGSGLVKAQLLFFFCSEGCSGVAMLLLQSNFVIVHGQRLLKRVREIMKR